MAQKNRDKEIWLIPKRVNVHQSICFLLSIKDLNYNNTSWGGAKQDRLGSRLGKFYKATKNGKNIAPQSIRTLLASIPQYLGFLYLDSTTTPSTLKITKAGESFIENHINEINNNLNKFKNLNEGEQKNLTIKTSDSIKNQLNKLIITNPIILKDCEGIMIYPFLSTLILLKKLDYLDIEEIAYFLFNIKDISELTLKSKEIINFRKISYSDRKDLIDEFKNTHIGNITLKKAPSARYFISLCLASGLLEEMEINIPNPGNKKERKIGLKIKIGKEKEIEKILAEFDISRIYDFEKNLDLWIDYIGFPERKFPPFDFKIKNLSGNDVIFTIEKNNKLLEGDLLNKNDEIIIPVFENENYCIKFIDSTNGKVLKEDNLIPDFLNPEYVYNCKNNKKIASQTIQEVASEIIEHLASKTFSKKMTSYLKILEKIDGIERILNKNLRGGHNEYLFFKLLKLLEKKGFVDYIIWNGKIGKYGLSTPAPGGKIGRPDIIFSIDSYVFILELTTIKAKSSQFSAEGASVPDHIINYYKETTTKPYGIFVAPQIHERNDSAMKAVLNKFSLDIICLTEKEFIDILLLEDKNKLLTHLLSFFSK